MQGEEERKEEERGTGITRFMNEACKTGGAKSEHIVNASPIPVTKCKALDPFNRPIFSRKACH